MCQYYYIYFSTCQHADFYRVSYCDRAKALGLPRLDGHSPNSNSADNTPDDLPDSSSPQPPASPANDSSSLHPYTQFNSHNMSTLVHSGAGASLARNAALLQHGEQLPGHIALIPRSALTEEGASDQEMYKANPVLDLRTYRSLNIDIPLGAQSSVSIEAIHDGKVTECVAWVDLYVNSALSDASQVSPADNGRASGMSLHGGSIPNMGTIRGSPSPRKPLPSQWLPVTNGPNLATAQRAKERGHKRGSAGGSPTEAKTPRGTRSLVDIGRAHGAEGQSFLTKHALAAVESDLTSPQAARSPTKRKCASSKPAWNSPATSPLRESSRQHSAFTFKTSPIKTFPSAEAASHSHERGNSVATSDGDSVYHSAETSPVSGTVETMPAFRPTVEVLDEDSQFSDFQLSANNEGEQTLRQFSQMPALTEAAAIGKRNTIKPRLKVQIPPLEPHSHDIHKSAASMTSAASSVGAGSTLSSPASISSISRIPRVAATNVTTPAAKSKRAQITMASQKLKAKQTEEQDSDELFHPNTMPATSVRYVHTVDSLDTTPVLSKCFAPDVGQSYSGSVEARNNVAAAQPTRAKVVRVASETTNTGSYGKLGSANSQTQEESSRSSSICTIKAPSTVSDPVMVDSSIIYSKKSGASGTFRQIETHVDNTSTASVHTRTNTRDPSPDRGRAKQLVPHTYRKEESEHSLQSSLGSDLRATAPEFVPLPPPSTSLEAKDPTLKPQIDASTDLLGSMAFDLDMYGIPWFYYMYQVQVAYNQGFQNGRSRSPKKFRQKKQKSFVSPSSDTYQPAAPVLEQTSEQEQRRMSIVPPPASMVHLSEQRAQQKRDDPDENVVVSIESSSLHETAAGDRAYSPFAAQKALIARQAAIGDTANVPRNLKVDITTIRNVALPCERRNTPVLNNYPKTMPNRGGHYNEHRRYYNRSDNGLYSYGSRGTVGVPMHHTVPFPTPMPPQGRPAYSMLGSEACGMVDIVVAAERGGGEACHTCEPDHPLE